MNKRVAFLATLIACAPKGFSPASFVDSLRVLAVTADKPIAAPNETVALEGLVADPLGGGRGVSFAYATCVNPGSGEIQDCARHIGSFQFAAIDPDGRAPFQVRVPSNVLESTPIGTVGVVFAVCAGAFAPPQGTAPIGCTRDGAAVSREGFMWGMKRIAVISGVRNENPRIGRIFFDRRRWDEGFELSIDACPSAELSQCAPELQHDVVVEVADGAREPYLDRTEDVVSFFYVSQGALRDEVVRSDSDLYQTIYAPTGIDAARPIEFWFVLRDDRGGMSFTKRSARIR